MKVYNQFTFDETLHISHQTSEAPDVVPGQSMQIAELLRRFTNGQRLNVPQFPQNILQDGDCDEDFSSVPPICEDIVDVEAHAAATAERKAAFNKRMSAKKGAALASEDTADDSAGK